MPVYSVTGWRCTALRTSSGRPISAAAGARLPGRPMGVTRTLLVAGGRSV